jgi:hypothetical protein
MAAPTAAPSIMLTPGTTAPTAAPPAAPYAAPSATSPAMRLSVAQALSEIELANAMAITDFFIIFLPIIELRTWLRERFSPATVHLSQSQQRRWTGIVPDSRQAWFVFSPRRREKFAEVAV